MRRLWRWITRLLLAGIICVVLLVSPVIYVETACRGDGVSEPYAAVLPPEVHRAEARTLMTYPEWHIVHAYDDYAKVISAGDPHDFGFLRSIAGFWQSLCALTEASARHGGVDGETRQLVYVIGVSFSAELLLKAAYEETAGRVIAMVRGSPRAPLDDLSARQAADYARFLQQTPWYKWDFQRDAQALQDQATGVLRDRERRFALGLEYGAKAAYARVIAAAVAATGADALRLRMLVDDLMTVTSDDITIVAVRPGGVEIEVPRYRKLTQLLDNLAAEGVDFIEIAGNDDILFTALSDTPTHADAIHSFARQGYDDHRHLILVKVTELADILRTLPGAGLQLEHIHDY
ncbi:hypothetical protein KX928_19390 [Roseobacter sp. YSTF-M11]|uniref:Uncharacterized protein n=1 Tax=Roseobacter insulae TaxID=2859783 RepID=A0A9X1FYH7_9RHOB|nr:hypothetical protein [Roseobacter insulae]MBW4709953.1 hypothetical protein [Roseobacter insulae]